MRSLEEALKEYFGKLRRLRGDRHVASDAGDEIMVGALIDRVLHHSQPVNMRGSSYRMREHAEIYRTLQSDV